MKTAGIIAEYNPFHNGHHYQIAQVRKKTGADFVIIAMSGDFLQRGVPAIIDKYTRTHMALLGGADLVLELPAVWATASAEYFAAAGVQLLAKTGVVTTLCYGCETPDRDLLYALAQTLCDSPEYYSAAVSALLKQGNSFPAARSQALCALLPAFAPERVHAFLASPNNILALEYEKALLRWNGTHTHTLKSTPIQRVGEGYHSTKTDVTFASATAIRSALLAHPAQPLDLARSAMLPAASRTLLQDAAEKNLLLDTDACSIALYTRLWALQNDGYAAFADCGEDLSRRILQHLEQYLGFSQFASLLKSKHLTYTRICRALLHILLDIHQSDYDSLWQPDGIPYLRVLGFSRSCGALLSALKKEASVPLITKVADASRYLSPAADKRLAHDIACADLYRGMASIQAQLSLPNEYRQPLILV